MDWVIDPLWPWSTAMGMLGALPLLSVLMPLVIILAVAVGLPAAVPLLATRGSRIVALAGGMILVVLAMLWTALQGALGGGGLMMGFRAVGGLMFFALPALLVGITIWTYIGIPRATTSRIGIILFVRLLAMMLAFLVAFRPSLAIFDKQSVRSIIYLLLDSSESMTILDEADQTSRWDHLQQVLKDNDPLLKQLQTQDTEVKAFQFSSQLSDYLLEKPGVPSGKTTDVGNALKGVIDRTVGQERFRGLLLFSDGADNGTSRQPALPLAQRLRDLSLNVHSFALGKPTTTAGQNDLALVSISTEPTPTIPLGGEISVKVSLNAPGFENALVGVRLLLDGVPVAAKIFQDDAEVKIAGAPGQTIQLKRAEGNEILIRHRPLATLGEVKVTVEVGDPRRDFLPLPGEISAANNKIDTYVTVVKEGTRVLLVDKLRAWEPQFICDALGKDSKISLFPVWLRGNDKPDDDVQDLFRFDQRNYDAIIFGDVTAAQVKALGNDILGQIERMVFEKGTGFLMLGGYSTFGNSDWKGTPIEKLLPVMLDVQGQIDAPIKMVPTDDGLRRYSYILKISNQVAGAQGAWAKLKELDGQTKLGSLKPGLSSVLAESDNKEPLLVTQNYGKGRTLAFGADTSYKWIRDPESRQNHARFWAQMVRWLAKQEEMEGSVIVIPDSRRIPANTELGFRVALRGKDGNELEAGKYQVQVFGPDGKAVRVPTSKKGTEERGAFLNSELSGEYKIEVEAEGKDPSGEVIAGKSSARFMVYDEDLEMTRRAADHDLLKKIATAGGGTFQRVEELKTFLQKMLNEPPLTEKAGGKYYPDWKSNIGSPIYAFIMIFFIGIVATEWLLRRWWGLV
ncbi:MAG: glutamine amidotransferase [Planctomycetota bacterium]